METLLRYKMQFTIRSMAQQPEVSLTQTFLYKHKQQWLLSTGYPLLPTITPLRHILPLSSAVIVYAIGVDRLSSLACVSACAVDA